MRRFSTQNLLPIGCSQQILLDDAGQLIISCDSLFPTESFRQIVLTEQFPFLESILPILQGLRTDDAALHFPKVETDHAFLPGTYDYYFSRIQLEEGSYILWSIYDYTKVYEDFRRFQQRRNELQVHRQSLEFRLQEFKRQEDLFQLDRAISQSAPGTTPDLRQLEATLSSPFNVLDGLTWMLTQSSAQMGQYVHSLEDMLEKLLAAVQQLRHHIDVKDWQTLQNMLQTAKPASADWQVELASELRAIPLNRLPYTAMVLQLLTLAFVKTGLQTKLQAELETEKTDFEKGNVEIEVQVNAHPSFQGIQTILAEAELQMYLLRSLVHQAGGLLAVLATDSENALHFRIRLPILPELSVD